ncbi:MAG: penicillin binding protein PBP4B, partial [Erysipelotrichaceae bacterium]|nr:penicillin binding protein PBP4B [Erysipelotrichaceae bacterium]
DFTNTEKNRIYQLDYAKAAVNGKKSIQISNIMPHFDEPANSVYVPYPVLIQGTLEEEGFDPAAFELIDDIITKDLEYGFTSAQLAIIRHGKLVYNNTWGYLNSYDQQGNELKDKVAANNDTMYDLASVSKMFGPNFALQKLVSEGKIDPEAKVADYLGERFYEDTLDFTYTGGADPGYETMKQWKASLKISDLLKHEGGFPAAPRYFNQYVDAPSQDYSPLYDNILFSGYEHSAQTKENTIEAICKTPLLYKPGSRTLYSDVDFMILGYIVEIVSGLPLDQYMKENFFKPLNLSRITYNPLENGYSKDDCAATELNGNTRDGSVVFPGARTHTLQGEVHDEMSWYSMNGVSGHAGLFSNAADLAKLAYTMFSGGYGYDKFFERNVIDYFISTKSYDKGNYGLGWARQGDEERPWYYGTQTYSDTVGHQGWTGTLAMIDFERDIVMVYLTNKINSPIRDRIANPNGFRGSWYTAATLGFVPQLFSIGLDQNGDHHKQLLSLLEQMTYDSINLIPENADQNHPGILNALSKIEVFRKWVSEYGDDKDKDALKRLEDFYNGR